MDTKEQYWNFVEDVAKGACALITDDERHDFDEAYEFVDDTVSGCETLPTDTLMRIVGWSKNPDAFHEWDPKDVPPESRYWWWMRAFYAITNDTYDRVREKGHAL